MRNIFLPILLLIPFVCFAGRETLDDGKTIAFWNDQTETILYNSYRVDVKLTKPYSKNVWGSVALYYDGKCAERKNFMIRIGEKKVDVDFDNLSNNIRYEIVVTIDGK